MKILIGSVISITPFSPGMAWNWMHHAVGFQKLGHEVYYLEEVEPRWCVDSSGQPCRFEDSVNRGLFQAIMERFGFLERACQVYHCGQATFGLALEALLAVAREADLLLNISGHVRTDRILSASRRRVYVDQDPVYTQLWLAEYGKDLNLKAHDVFVSVGLNIGTPYSQIPSGGVEWRHALPPVVLDYWPWRFDPSCRRFTTIASWSGFGDLCYRGEWYRSKEEEFTRLAELPRQAGQECEVALRRHRQDDEGVRRLRDSGWALTEASQIADLTRYQDYLARSRAEIGIAKNAYVKGHSGWFSDRTAHYLASGKPALVQATGFERHLPTGRGLLAFDSLEEAVAGVEAINQDYEGHCRAAREFAAEFLDYRKVLPKLLDACTA
jgi:hypothetical protein